MEFIGKTKIDFIGKRNISFIISGVIALIGIIGIIQISRNAANMGIDFTGGTAMQLKFSKPIGMEDARKALLKSGLVALTPSAMLVQLIRSVLFAAARCEPKM